MTTINIKFNIETSPDWQSLDKFSDRTIGQSRAWLNFISESQNAKPIVLSISDDNSIIGYFTGAVIKKIGLKILGSPFPGWTTSYMGLNLMPEYSRIELLKELTNFVFNKLQCIHFEIMDRNLSVADAEILGWNYRVFRGFEINLNKPVEQLLAKMTSACRRCIRKAEREKVIIESVESSDFAKIYYSQLKDVFGKQRLIPTYTLKRVELLIKNLLPTGQLLLLKATDRNGIIIGTGIFPAMNDTMYFWGGASLRQFQISRPNEALQWHAMQYWKLKGIAKYDMGGGGDYKRKYGGQEIAVPWMNHSKYKFLSTARNSAKEIHRFKQKVIGLISK